MKNKTKILLSKYWYIAIIIIAIIIKHILTINLPLWIRDNMGADEYLMLYQSEQLLSGNYLGPYNYLTLVKGIGFPLFIAFAYKCGLSYLQLFSLFYTIACLIAIIPIKKLVKNKGLQLLFFIILLFCPATYDSNVMLMYRNMLIAPQSILLLSSLMMMYFNIKNKDNSKLLIWSFISSFSWIFMWHTREDSIWSLPLLIVVWLVLFICLLNRKNINKKENKVFCKLIIISIPFISLFLSIQAISFINYKYYGVYTTNQLNNSNYTKAVMLMMKVKPKKEIDKVEITRETLKRLYDVSPTLKKLEVIIENDYENKTPLLLAGGDNGEFNEDLITWELTGAANSLGYYKDAKTAENFWKNVYEEISVAIKDGKLKTRTTLPSRSLIPFPTKKGSIGQLFSSILKLFVKSSNYEDVYISSQKTVVDEEQIIRRYEMISGSYGINKDKGIVTVNGYIFSKNNNEYFISLENSLYEKISKIEFIDSQDIYDYYVNNENIDCEHAKKSRYISEIEVDIDVLDDVFVVVRNNSNDIIAYYQVSNLENSYFSEDCIYSIDYSNTNISVLEDTMMIKSKRYIKLGNKLLNIYRTFGFSIFIISTAFYLILSIILIISIFKKNILYFDEWLILSEILGSVTVLIFGLGYVNAFMVNVHGYMTGCYVLIDMFSASSFVIMLKLIFNLIKDRITKKNKNSRRKKNKGLNELIMGILNFDFKLLFNQKTNNSWIQFFRYIFVGGIAAIVNIGMLWVFTEIFKIYYIVSNILSFLLGLLTNYILSKKFVFQDDVSIDKSKEFIIYAIIGVLGLCLDTILIKIFTSWLLIHYLISKLISTAIVFIWNFGARKVLYKLIK